jgi:serine/threonine protein kinase
VVLRILQALQAAHAASLVHCDVRPSNIVVVPGAGAMLVDWGISRAVGAEARGCGVAAYADRRVFEQGKYQARAVQDVIGALLTWLCVAHSELCDAPWCTSGPLEAVFAARQAWMEQRSGQSAAVARVVKALHKAETQRSWAGKEEELFALACEAVAT